jgi:hypothetical protein
MKNSVWIVSLLLMSLLATPTEAQRKGLGGGPSFDFRKKSESKEGTRWTLKEWLEQKDRNHLMDLWLGMYAPSPYEFFISGQMLSYDRTSSTITTTSTTTGPASPYRSSSGALAAYATVVGLMGEYENNHEEGFNDLAGSLNLRLIGNAVQGTHLIVNYGQRTRNTVTSSGVQTLRQNFASVDLDLYVMKYFGLHGNYRSDLPTSDANLGDVSGSKTETGAFIDFAALRIYGNWYSEKQDATRGSQTDRTVRTGIQSGIKFFF